MYHIKKTDRLDITINETQKNILVQQKWRYIWTNAAGTSDWTYQQKKNFHRDLDRLIWSKWGQHGHLKVTGNSDFALKNKDTVFPLLFDLKWVLSGEHWRVNVKKIPKGSFEASNVIWGQKVINLDTEDVLRRQVATGIYQYPVAHEFGHAVGNSVYAFQGGHGDEYRERTPYFADKHSMMNIGSSLRERHLDYLIRELNTLFPATSFYVHKIF